MEDSPDTQDALDKTNIPTSPYRLVCHSLEDGNSHVDLFLRPIKVDMLYTYELSAEFGYNFVEENKGLSPQAIPLFASNRSSGQITTDTGHSGDGTTWLASRKRDHRLHYWQYSGVLSCGQGSIRELGRGTVFLYKNFTFDLPENDYNDSLGQRLTSHEFVFSEQLYLKFCL